MVRLLTGSRHKVLIAGSVAPYECLRGVERFAREHDWHLVMDMLFTGSLPRGWTGSGALAMLPYQPDLLAHLRATGVPCVVCTGDGETFPRVETDHAAIGRLAADHLLQRAHRSFAWAPFLNDAANRDRLAAFQSRLAEHGCGCRLLPALHTRIGPYWQGNWTEHRRLLTAELLRLPRPTAVFAFNDCVATNLVDACRDAGLRLPEDIAVLGVGNSIVAQTSPVPLSSVDDNMEELGYQAAALLERLMGDPDIRPELVRVPPRGIVTRVSTDIVAVNDPRVARALSYIAEHYPDPMLTVCKVADAVGISRRNLERSFRDETGGTINDYIIAIRMREASRLLKAHPRAKSSEIAALVGIPGAGTFFRTFRRYFGTSPSSHRETAEPDARADAPGKHLRASSVAALHPAQRAALSA